MIRRVIPSTDAATITRIYNRYICETTVSFETEPLSVEQMQKRIEDIASKYPYFVYEKDGVVIGYAYVHNWKERAAYQKTVEATIYLDFNCKREGVGTKLATKIIQASREMGFHAIIACITEENRESLEFHKKMGFKKVSHFLKVGEKFGRQLDVVDMELQL